MILEINIIHVKIIIFEKLKKNKNKHFQISYEILIFGLSRYHFIGLFLFCLLLYSIIL